MAITTETKMSGDSHDRTKKGVSSIAINIAPIKSLPLS